VSRRFRFCIVAAVLFCPAGARAGSLTVSPITVEVVTPATTATVTARNGESRPLAAQIRVFRWTQVDGQDRLDPTEDVVASPPVVTINGGADYVVRLERTAGREIAGEEAYRVVVDELPNPNRQRNGSVALVLRYLIPAFFFSADATQPKLVWSLAHRGGATILQAVNSGDKRIQIVDLKLGDANRALMVGKGLAGYVLGHSTHSWVVPAGSGLTNAAVVSASSDHGAIHASLSQ
jgi:fimbrial chaperone protein